MDWLSDAWDKTVSFDVYEEMFCYSSSCVSVSFLRACSTKSVNDVCGALSGPSCVCVFVLCSVWIGKC